MCGRRKIENISRADQPVVGDLVYVTKGIRHKIGIIIAVDATIWHKHIQDWYYYIMIPDSSIIKQRGWNVEKIKPYRY